MFLKDILQVIYAPKKAFKSILTNQKYLGVILIFVLFIGLQVAYEYTQFSKVTVETTSPIAGLMQENNNATSWVAGPGVTLSNNFDDYFNNTVYIANYYAYYSLFGNNSMQIQANNTDNVLVVLSNTSNVDCTANGFQNLSLTLKQVSPQTAPSNAILTLYSLSDTNYYTYDLTSAIADANAINQWGNLTIPVGPDAAGWTENGNPSWQNITSLTLELSYPNSENVTIRIGALFFRGQYVQLLQTNLWDFIGTFTLEFTMQFLITWLALTGMIYIILKALKSPMLWKPIFIAAGFTLVILVIRAAVNIIAAATLAPMAYPYDVAFGTVYDILGSLYYPATAVLPVAESAAAISAITASMATFKTIITAMLVISYIWIAALVAIMVKEAKPEFSNMKAIIVGAVSVVATIAVLVLLVLFAVVAFI